MKPNLKLRFAICLGAVLSATSTLAQSNSIEGEMRIDANRVTVDGKSFEWNDRTQCSDQQQVQLTCATLAAVGYADRARVTASGDKAIRIEILNLQQ